MKRMMILASFNIVFFAGLEVVAELLSDEQIKERIVDFVMLPGRLCGRAAYDFRKEISARTLVNRSWFDGDTNRLARLVCELAQTNDCKMASLFMDELGRYATSEQLPFLYSCATNPAIGHKAMKAVLNVEGITSNSLESLGRYFALTNTIENADHPRAELCARVMHLSKVNRLCNSSISNIVNTYMLSKDCNGYWFDTICIKNDATYKFSKRRLAFLRGVVTNAVQWEFQINYVTNAIKELVAYPEADLPE